MEMTLVPFSSFLDQGFRADCQASLIASLFLYF
jgi:hypothetical protein